jgi:hypothetical protein
MARKGIPKGSTCTAAYTARTPLLATKRFTLALSTWSVALSLRSAVE